VVVESVPKALANCVPAAQEFDFLCELLEYENANLREEVYKTEATD
jgi:hypothetical protein